MAPEVGKEKSSFVVQGKALDVPLQNPVQKNIFSAQISFRILAILLTLASISVIVTNRQTIFILGFQIKARYFYSSAFKFLVGVDVVVCVCSALSSIFLFFLTRSEAEPKLKKYFFVFVHDTVVLVLAVSGCAAATAIGYVSRYGEEDMTWQAVCDQVNKYCHRMTIALVLSYLAFFAYLTLTLMSARRLMSRPSV
ncbi:hypothetical protein UlMin_013872 [Ulmus minor]